MPGKQLNSQSQELVLKLLHYFEMEKENGGPLVPINCVQERVSEALGISLSTVSRIKHKSNRCEGSIPAKKPRNCRKPKTSDLDEPIKMEVRNTVYNMYKQKKHVTLCSLREELEAKEILQISTMSLRTLLLHLGFKYKAENNRKVLMERSNIVAKRSFFLRKYRANKVSSHPSSVVFLDETWIYAKGNARKSWQDDSTASVRKPGGFEGKRFIVLHAGTRDGFINDCSLLFASKSKLLDYHGEMNSELFSKWVKESLIPNLEEPSIIIMDNAPYHSVQAEKQPTSAWKKSNISEWLMHKGIPYEEGITKQEMLQIAKRHKEEVTYVIDELLREHGHEVLRLPPYHCQFNAIELVWAKAKTYYDKNIGRDGYGDDKVLNMWKEALLTCTPNIWSNCVEHTDRVIEEWYQRDVLIEDVTEIRINLDESSSDSE